MKAKVMFMLIMCLLLFAFSGLCAADSGESSGQTRGDVEISFKVGDNVLSINGASVEVETPYVADGVTLVPVRVITEAFGATVDWIDATREIILTYQSVEIILQINNTDVYVNGQKQTLLHHPTLPDKTTMVPLRFITENFGADVNYDEETQLITVVKSASAAPLDAIESALRHSSKPFIGDSYLEWSMANSPELSLEHRSFDGRTTIFSIGDNNTILIAFSDNTEGYTFETLKILEMESAKGNTLIGQDELTTKSGQKYVRTQYRNRILFVDSRKFLRPDGQIISLGIVSLVAEEQEKRDIYLKILDSMDFTVPVNDMEDLSNVANGMRMFDNKDFGIELLIPADWRDVSDGDVVNRFVFCKIIDGSIITGTVSLTINSQYSDDTAAAWAARDLSRNRKVTNPKIYKYSDLKEMTVSAANAYYYVKEENTHGVDCMSWDIFWEHEGYLYNLYIMAPAKESALLQKIADSVSFTKVDKDNVGFLYMDKSTDDEDGFVTVIKNQVMRFSVEIPATWINNNNDEFLDTKKGLYVDIYPMPMAPKKSDIDNVVTVLAQDLDNTFIQKTTTLDASELASGSYSGYVYEYYSAGAGTYFRSYTIIIDNRCFQIYTMIKEEFYSDACRATIAKIIKSFKSQ